VTLCILAEYKASHPGTELFRVTAMRISNLSKQQNTALFIPGAAKLTKNHF
jgi:hypothetical protein